jgi:bifunctional non-homologous end joining protein LigD
MAVSMRVLPAGFVPPCLPTKARQPPSGELWLHEIKHDGFRVIARKNGKHVRLYSRPGNDLTYRFALIVGTVLIELNGDDLRREPFDTRKATLASLLRRAGPGLRLNEHIEADGPTVYAHACKMGWLLEAKARDLTTAVLLLSASASF